MRVLFIQLIVAAVTLVGCSRDQKRNHQSEDTQAQAATGAQYTCAMHPQVIRDKPGTCPICGMDLVRADNAKRDEASLMLTDNQIILANITTGPVSVKPLGQTRVVNAKLTENQDRTEVISSRAAGRIERLFVRETGRAVRPGEPLYELYSETLLTLQREYLLAKAQYETMGREPRYGSFLKASEGKLLLYGITRKQIETLAQSEVIQQRITFFAPVGGVVSEVKVNEGQYVDEGSLLYRIERIEQLWLEAELYSHETASVKVGDKLSVRINGFEATPLESKVTFLSPAFRANTQIIVIRALIENPGLKFKPGMQAQVLFTSGSRQALSVPAGAVIRDGRGAHVYLVTAANTFLRRAVKTGLEDLDQVEISEGLQAGDRIAVTGAYLLYSEMILKKGADLELESNAEMQKQVN